MFDFHVPFPSLYLVFQATMGHRQRLQIGVEGRRFHCAPRTNLRRAHSSCGVVKKSAFPLRRAQRGEFAVFAKKDRIIMLLLVLSLCPRCLSKESVCPVRNVHYLFLMGRNLCPKVLVPKVRSRRNAIRASRIQHFILRSSFATENEPASTHHSPAPHLREGAVKNPYTP